MTTEFQCLELWRHTLVASVRSDSADLSARQMGLLLSVYMGSGPHTVRGMALELRISKPAVSRALDRLGELGYIRRQRDEIDRRNVLVQRTPEGQAFLDGFAQMIASAARHVASLPEQQLSAVIESLAEAQNAMQADEEVATTADNVWNQAA